MSSIFQSRKTVLALNNVCLAGAVWLQWGDRSAEMERLPPNLALVDRAEENVPDTFYVKRRCEFS
jgi:hypothetical protein